MDLRPPAGRPLAGRPLGVYDRSLVTGPSRLRPGRRAAAIAIVSGVLVALLVPAVASAHPLGNFTINHYAGIRVEPDRIDLDVVIDEAEIPTFSERQRIDTDGSGTVSDDEVEAERQVACGRLAGSLELRVDGEQLPLSIVAAGLSFPPGAAGLATMRLVCEYVAVPAGPLQAGSSIDFADPSNADHLGWHEIVATGDGTTIAARGIPTTSISKRLTAYPPALIPKPLAVSSATIAASPGGLTAAAPCVPDAFSLAAPAPAEIAFGCGPAPTASAPVPHAPAPGAAVAPVGRGAAGLPSGTAASAATVGAVPGGVGSEISGLLETRDVTPTVLLLSLLTAIALGAAHALTPGHGKTVMAAYLVGTRGTTRQALGLGLTVTASHTLGVLALAAVILAFHVVAPDSYNHVAGIVAGLIVVAIGGWMVAGQVAARSRAQAADATGEHVHDGGPHHRHRDDDPHGHDHGHDHPSDHDGALVQSASAAPGGPAPVSRRSLFALGLFGGLVPSINALVILLAALTTGRAAYGFVLVVAFGVGMAIVLTGIGLGLVHAGRWMGGRPSWSVPARLFRLAPAVAAFVILVVGLYVTGQAILGTPTL
jgi:nickel/cobalt transporter (NicO) family protein